MNTLARAKIDKLKYRGDVFKEVLSHFGNREDAKATAMLLAAVDHAYTDDLLFEDFEIWVEEKNDGALLYNVEHFLKAKGQ